MKRLGRHRRWFVSSVLYHLLEEDFALAATNRRYEWLNRIDAHRAALFTQLRTLQTSFGACAIR